MFAEEDFDRVRMGDAAAAVIRGSCDDIAGGCAESAGRGSDGAGGFSEHVGYGMGFAFRHPTGRPRFL